MSDRVPGATTLEERMDDIRAVMDAAGSERAAIIGESEGGPLSMLFAAAHPERTVALILAGSRGPGAPRRGVAVGRGDGCGGRGVLRRHSGELGKGQRVPVPRAERRRRRMGTGLARAGRSARRDAGCVGGIRTNGARHRRSRRRLCDQGPDADHPRGRRPGLPRRERPIPRADDFGSEVRRARRW